jgi:hypothetical protein
MSRRRTCGHMTCYKLIEAHLCLPCTSWPYVANRVYTVLSPTKCTKQSAQIRFQMALSNPVADAAITITNGQLASLPNDNSPRSRKCKGKKSRQRFDRNTRSDEEIRFNVGTPRPRSPLINGRGRRQARPGGYRHGRRDEGFHEGRLLSFKR